jgi:membrane protein
MGIPPIMTSKKSRRGTVETLVVPVASTVVLATAAVHSVVDRRQKAADGNGTPSAEAPPPGLPERLAGRFRWLRTPFAVNKRYGEIGGNQLAAAFTFQAFVSIFPLMLSAVAIIGFVSASSDTDLAGRLVKQLGLTGAAAKSLTDAFRTAESSRQAASVIGVLGLLWSGLGLVGGLQYAYNAVWQVNDRGMKDKAIGLAWLGGAAILFVGGAVLTTALRWLPGFLAPAGVVVSFLVSLGLWLWTLRILPNVRMGWRDLLPGAIFGAVGLEVLKVAGAYWVPKMVASSSQLYGFLGVVFAVLAWLLFFGRLVIYSAVLNVVLYERRAGTVQAVVQAPPVPGARHAASRSGRLATGS